MNNIEDIREATLITPHMRMNQMTGKLPDQLPVSPELRMHQIAAGCTLVALNLFALAVSVL